MLAKAGIEQAQPQLHQHGSHQHDHHRDREGHGSRMQDLIQGGFCQFKADHQHHGRHRKAGQVFISRVAVGMVFIRRLLRQLETNERHDGGSCVGQVVHSIGGNGHRAGYCADKQFAGAKKRVGKDAHHAGKLADLGAHCGICSILVILYKKF